MDMEFGKMNSTLFITKGLHYKCKTAYWPNNGTGIFTNLNRINEFYF